MRQTEDIEHQGQGQGETIAGTDPRRCGHVVRTAPATWTVASHRRLAETNWPNAQRRAGARNTHNTATGQSQQQRGNPKRITAKNMPTMMLQCFDDAQPSREESDAEDSLRTPLAESEEDEGTRTRCEPASSRRALLTISDRPADDRGAEGTTPASANKDRWASEAEQQPQRENSSPLGYSEKNILPVWDRSQRQPHTVTPASFKTCMHTRRALRGATELPTQPSLTGGDWDAPDRAGEDDGGPAPDRAGRGTEEAALD